MNRTNQRERAPQSIDICGQKPVKSDLYRYDQDLIQKEIYICYTYSHACKFVINWNQTECKYGMDSNIDRFTYMKMCKLKSKQNDIQIHVWVKLLRKKILTQTHMSRNKQKRNSHICELKSTRNHEIITKGNLDLEI